MPARTSGSTGVVSANAKSFGRINQRRSSMATMPMSTPAVSEIGRRD